MKKTDRSSAIVVSLATAALFGWGADTGALGDDALSNLIFPKQYEARRESSSNEDLHKNGDAKPIEPGETLVLGELEGPGVISRIWTTVGSDDPFFSNSLVLRIYWDGAEHPSVEAPLGIFHGLGFGSVSSFASAAVVIVGSGRSYNCFWKMPFREKARVTVTNQSEDYRTNSFYYHVEWQKHAELPEDTPYFHARYRQATPAEPGDYTILETTGTGHHVGTVYSVLQVETGWFGEGDDRFYIDGEEWPSLRGTGTEEHFGDAWGFRQYCTDFFGVSLWEGYFPGDRNTAYRWYVENPIPFSKSLKMTIEHRGSVFTDEGQNLGQFTERPDWLSSVAYWYQLPVVEFTDPIPPAPDRLPPYRLLPGSDLVVRASPEEGIVKDGASLVFQPRVSNGSVEFEFEITDPGRYQISALMGHSVFSCVYQAYLDDEPLGEPRDFYMSGNDPIWVRFDLHDLEEGKHVLRFVGKGDSPRKRTLAPPFRVLAMGYLCLLRMEDVKGYHEALEKLLEEAQKSTP